jgi:very-short-patch-repair endonuclease
MHRLNAVHGVIERQLQSKWLDRWIAETAERQHGVVARRQLLEIGIGPAAIDHRVRLARLHVLYRGVYAVGHLALTVEGRWMAAVLATGPGAVLSHRAAASCHDLWSPSFLDVTAPHARRGRPGIRVHYLSLPPDEVTTVRGIPVTTVPRTLFDLASVLPQRLVERAVNEAEMRQLLDPLSLADLVDRHTHRHGIRAIRSILDDLRVGGTVVRSELEWRFRQFVRSRRLPPPEFNAHLFVAPRWFECDCLWRAEQLIVELDGRAAHGTSAAFERDRARDRTLNTSGWRVVRVTWRQLREEPEALAADLVKMLQGKKRT